MSAFASSFDAASREAVSATIAEMTREQAYILLNDIVRDVLGEEPPPLHDAVITAEVPGWDSFANISILAAVEIRFGVEIRCAEAERLSRAGDIVDLVLAKLRQPAVP